MGSGRKKKNQVFQIAPALVVGVDGNGNKLTQCPVCAGGDSTGCAGCHGTGTVPQKFAATFDGMSRISSDDFTEMLVTPTGEIGATDTDNPYALSPAELASESVGNSILDLDAARRDYQDRVAAGTATAEDSANYYRSIEQFTGDNLAAISDPSVGMTEAQWLAERKAIGRAARAAIAEIPENDLRGIAFRDGFESNALVDLDRLQKWADPTYREADGSRLDFQQRFQDNADRAMMDLLRGGTYKGMDMEGFLAKSASFPTAPNPTPEGSWAAGDTDMWEMRNRIQGVFGSDDPDESSRYSNSRKMEAFGLYRKMMNARMEPGMNDAQRAMFDRERQTATKFMQETVSAAYAREQLDDLRGRIADDLGISRADADRYMTPASMLSYADPYSGRDAKSDIAAYKVWDSGLNSVASDLKPYTNGGVISLDSLDANDPSYPDKVAGALDSLQKFGDYVGPDAVPFRSSKPPAWMPEGAKSPGFSPAMADFMKVASSDRVAHQEAIRRWASRQTLPTLKAVAARMDTSGGLDTSGKTRKWLETYLTAPSRSRRHEAERFNTGNLPKRGSGSRPAGSRKDASARKDRASTARAHQILQEIRRVIEQVQ